ncbi:uncharacterized protein P174DRAFT_430281 [Aspergillus novofumigatus IBT 16806]|uniref:Uncharacterized protein n=1 Tax=Aspergillus novofumigatus (strain IBT 16806) TaxID=1392255 RepID=A0A2I1CED3_ASPN1|nr:uncharacterized protein P174DRAFT_430281 [Aspergillus novofumigatus IBT 16806]PKX95974.1 hypothetical protein P174DRAFT_430281 [Aspergillus novofumigatus IBT 16806]
MTQLSASVQEAYSNRLSIPNTSSEVHHHQHIGLPDDILKFQAKDMSVLQTQLRSYRDPTKRHATACKYLLIRINTTKVDIDMEVPGILRGTDSLLERFACSLRASTGPDKPYWFSVEDLESLYQLPLVHARQRTSRILTTYRHRCTGPDANTNEDQYVLLSGVSQSATVRVTGVGGPTAGAYETITTSLTYTSHAENDLIYIV